MALIRMEKYPHLFSDDQSLLPYVRLLWEKINVSRMREKFITDTEKKIDDTDSRQR